MADHGLTVASNPIRDAEDEKRRERFETEEDLRTLKQMAELKQDPKRMRRAKEATAEQEKVINSMEKLRSVVSEKLSEQEEEDDVERGTGSLTGVTTINGEELHRHTFAVDESGDGETQSTLGQGPRHKHVVSNYRIQEGGEDKHTHEKEVTIKKAPPLQKKLDQTN